MFAATIPFVVALLIITADVSIVNGETEDEKCAKRTSFDVLTDAQTLTTNLYYDAGKDLIDFGFITSMCTARKTYSAETFNFFVGASVVQNAQKVVECPHADLKNKDCTEDIEHVCASKIIPDHFPDFVCCWNGGKVASQCVGELDQTKKDEYAQCIQLKHPQIKPDQVLLDNAKAAAKVDPGGNWFPILTFNDKKADYCARSVFYYNPVRAICILLASCK